MSRRFCLGQAGFRDNLQDVFLPRRFRHIELDEFVIIFVKRRGTARGFSFIVVDITRRAPIVLIQGDQAVLDGKFHQCRHILQVQFLHNAAAVGFHRLG